MVFKKGLILAFFLATPTKLAHANELDLLASTVYLEARGASKREKFLVARVIVNRKKHKDFPGTVAKVLKQHKQFAKRKPINKDSQAYKDSLHAAKKALKAQANPKSIIYFHDKSYKKGFGWARPLITTKHFIFYGD